MITKLGRAHVERTGSRPENNCDHHVRHTQCTAQGVVDLCREPKPRLSPQSEPPRQTACVLRVMQSAESEFNCFTYILGFLHSLRSRSPNLHIAADFSCVILVSSHVFQAPQCGIMLFHPTQCYLICHCNIRPLLYPADTQRRRTWKFTYAYANIHTIY